MRQKWALSSISKQIVKKYGSTRVYLVFTYCYNTCNGRITVNWHGQNSNLIFTGGSDGIIRLWDVRNYNQPIKR